MVTQVQCLIGALVLAGSAHAFEGTWYLGAGAGMSRLAPDTDGSDFTLTDDASVAANVYLGLDVTDWLSAEVGYTDLGEATLSGSEKIGYSAFSVGAVGYVLGHREADERQEGLSGFLRLGLNSMDNSATIALDKSDSTSVWLGAGVQWPLGRQWGLRAELSSYDGDAQAALASIYWRSKGRDGARAAIPEPQAPPAMKKPAVTVTPVPKPKPLITPDKPAAVPTPQQPAKTPALSADCSVPAAGEPTDANGCALFSGVLAGVEFVSGSAKLAPQASAQLDTLAESLNQHPDLVIEIQVHTDESLGADGSMALSRERVLSVARYLAGQSVNVKRLRARAFGATMPRADNNTAAGRKLNNRVVLRVL